MNGMNAVLLLFFASVYAANGEDDKRYSTNANKAAGLFPFPRVGRGGSGGKLLWSLEAPTVHDAVKRQGLFSFPRVGRVDRQRLFPGATLMYAAPSRGEAVGTPMIAREIGVGDVAKRDSEEVAGMWFGPRLGRRDKREADSPPWTFVALKEFPSGRHRGIVAPHLGREFNEEPDDRNFDDDDDTYDLPLRIRPVDKSNNKSQLI